MQGGHGKHKAAFAESLLRSTARHRRSTVPHHTIKEVFLT
jgi:hypothetical protein